MCIRDRLYAEAAQILYLDDPVGFWLFDMYTMVAHSNKVEGVTVSGTAMVTFEKATVRK